MLVTTMIFTRYVTRNVRALMQAQKLGRRDGAALLWHIFVKPGLIRRIILPYLRYYVPGFHPNHIDDRRTLERTRHEIAAWA